LQGHRSNGVGSGLILIAWAWLLCLPRAILKTIVIFAICYIFLKGNALNWLIALGVGMFPILRSVFMAVTGLGDGWFTRQSKGARLPSNRERERIYGLMSKWAKESPEPIRMPDRVYILDTGETHNSFAIGKSIFIFRGAIATPHFAGILAHELGHVNAFDSRVVLAINGLEPQALNLVRGKLPLAGSLHFFLSARPVMNRLFGFTYHWWSRRREFDADLFAARCGVAPDLISCLEDLHDFDAPMPWTIGQSHPYTEFRIDRLESFMTASRNAARA
jgi:Zn-dependent protease with chaperone function